MVKAKNQTASTEEESFIDTSHMNRGQREVLEIAEAAREKEYKRPSFMRKLFMGEFDKSMVIPYPEHPDTEREREADELIEKICLYLEQNLDPNEVDRTRTIPDEVIKELAKLGAFALKVPKEYDGLGFSQWDYNRLMMRLGSFCGSTATLISAHQSIGVPEPLKIFGTEEQKKKYLPRFRTGAISAFALTEVGVGSDPAKMETEARLSEDGKHYILNGEKLWCTNGPIAEVLVVMANTEPIMVHGEERKQITAFIVESAWEGVEVLHRCDFMGLRAINNGFLRFTNVKVPVENILWEKGRGLALALKTLNTGRLTIPACCTGLAKQALSICRRWGKERVQWGQSVGKHEAGSQKIAYIASMAFAMEAMTFICSHWADERKVDIRIEAAIAKLYCSEAAWKIADEALQLRGGRGYERAESLEARGEVPYPVERMMRDARINTIIEGTSEIMRLFVSREALDPHLGRAKGLINPRSSTSTRVKTALQLLGFYAAWYPKQVFGQLFPSSHSEAGELATHLRFVEKNAHRLGRKIFNAMARYAQKLESQQVLLAHLMDIGCELFAMAVTVSYALHKQNKQPSDRSAVQLAEHFCSLARKRVRSHFKALSCNDTKASNSLASEILEDKMRWLEEEIIWCGPDE